MGKASKIKQIKRVAKGLPWFCCRVNCLQIELQLTFLFLISDQITLVSTGVFCYYNI